MKLLIFFLLALNVEVNPKVLRLHMGERIPVEVTVYEDDLQTNPERVIFKVVPQDLGHMEGNEFVADRPGRGILFVRAKHGRSWLKARRLIEVFEEERIDVRIIPDFIKIMPGESEKLKLELHPEPANYNVRWRVLPGELGYIENTSFHAEEPGAGKIIAVVRAGKSRGIGEADVLVGVPEEVTHELKLIPEEAVLNVLDTLTFNIRTPFEDIKEMEFFVFPERVGKIINEKFIAKRPGKAEVWALVRSEKRAALGKATVLVKKKRTKFVRFDPPYLVLKPGKEEILRIIPNIIPRRLRERRPNVVWEVEPKSIGSIKGRGISAVFKAKDYGTGVVRVKLKRSGRVLGEMPVLIVEEPINVIPERAVIGETDTLIINVSGGKRFSYSVFPEDAGKVESQRFIPSGMEEEAFVIVKGDKRGGISHILIRAETP